MASKPRGPDHDVNIQVGIMLGCEWPQDEIAKHFGVSTAAIYQRKKLRTNRQEIEKITSWTRLAVARYIQSRIHEAENEIAERKKSILSKGYRTIEKTLDAALDADTTEVGAVHLKAAEMGIERTEGKPLDRKAILELTGDDLNNTRQIDGADLENVLQEAARLNELRKKALPALPAYTEAETLD